MLHHVTYVDNLSKHPEITVKFDETFSFHVTFSEGM